MTRSLSCSGGGLTRMETSTASPTGSTAPVGRFQMHDHLRVRSHETGQHVADVRVQQCHRTGHPHGAAQLGTREFHSFLCGLGLHQHRLAMLVMSAANFGHAEAARRALDQPNTEPFLQHRNPPAKPGLGHSQCSASRRESAVLDRLHIEVEII